MGIPVSIGIAPTRTLAKLANRVAKEDSRFDGAVILKDKKIIQHFLKSVEIKNIWGIGKRMSAKLNDLGIQNALQLSEVNPRTIGSNFSVVLERTVRELRGQACIETNNLLEPKKQIMVSRSFGRSVKSKEILREAVSFHAGRAAEKLRFEGQKCRTITVFIRSNPFNKQIRQIYSSDFMEIIHATSDSRIIIKTANKILEKIYREGFEYSKAGILLSNFTEKLGYQMNLFDKSFDSKKADDLMRTVDYINIRDISNIFFGNQGYRNTWKMKRQIKSKRYTTRIEEIPVTR